MRVVLSILIALVMIGGGAAHLLATAKFAPLVPPFLPATPVILVAGVIQIMIGIAALLPRTRALAGMAFAALCLAYLPLHVWDYFRVDPVFAPPVKATVRVAMQLLFIWMGYTLWNRSRGPQI